MLEAFNRAQKVPMAPHGYFSIGFFAGEMGDCFHIIGKPCIKYEHANDALMLAMDMKSGSGQPQLFTPQMQRSK